MQIFELHFNPKLKEEQIFDSFIYEPENSYEKKLGSLYIVGELNNSTPSSLKFLNNIAQVVRKNYYSFSIKTSEKALSQASKKTNEFLSEQVKKENVGWLGNLNFGMLSLNKTDLTFTKTGDLKIILLRQGEIIDMGKNLDLQDIDPYPLKIFFNVVSGKLAENDKILVLTKDVFNFFKEQNILFKLSRVRELNQKVLKQILPTDLFNKGDGGKVSGICFIVVLAKQAEKGKNAILFESKALSRFSRIRLPRIRLPKIFKKKSKIPRIKVSIKKPGPLVEKFKRTRNIKRKLILIIVLVLILFLGFYAFQGSTRREEKRIKVSLEEIQEKVDEANNLLIFKNEDEANSLFIEAWHNISLLNDQEISFETEIISLKNQIEESLKELNKIENIEDPEIALEIDDEYMKPLSSISETNIFFRSPNTILMLKNDKWQERDIVSFPSFNLDIFSSYLSNLYFLDREKCEIIKYSYTGSSWSSAQEWSNNKDKCSQPKSMAVDGSVWVLNNDNSISIYYSGDYQKNIVLDIFPPIKNIVAIRTKLDVPYLYLLEPENNRVIIIDKQGKLVKQFQSEKFNDLKDFDISPSGKTIYLLNNDIIYKISL